MKTRIDLKSFLIGALSVLLIVSTISAAGDSFNQDEVSRLKRLAGYLQPDGNLNIGPKKIIMQGSSIYDDGSQGGGLILRGGANRVNINGNAVLYEGIEVKRPQIDLNANLNMGNKKIIMQGSSVYDDGSEGGGLILRGGANRVHLHGNAVMYDNPEFKRDTVDINANLNMGNKKIIMLGSSVYDDGSQGGGLILRGGANRINMNGNAIIYEGVEFKRDTITFNANLDMGNKKIIMLGSRIYDDGSEGGGLQLRGGANRIHFFGQTLPH